MANNQKDDKELAKILAQTGNSSLVLEPFIIGDPVVELFELVHIDIVAPLPPSEGFRYCLTCVDRLSKWPEAFPLADITAKSVASTFYARWIARFGIPLQITTDQGTLFEASPFDALTKFLGSVPSSNKPLPSRRKWSSGNISLTAKGSFRAAWKEDLQATTAEMVYGTPIRLAWEFLCPSTATADPTNFVGKLKKIM
ncbi:protein NYNRIN-like [Parasteatoda tepidariorum]|uniref:protein NYNRIN-like n=1 Tax=Parasteatoda tepidariorum TaxID=114398 RepID=UPI0039BCBCFE